MAFDPAVTFLTDAYMVQHPGAPSPQSIQSVAVHLLALCGYLERGLPASSALWLRQRAVGDARDRHRRYDWLTPPSFADCLTLADIVHDTPGMTRSPEQRTKLVGRHISEVWTAWSAAHGVTIAGWYDRYVASAT